MTKSENLVDAPPFDLKERTFQYARRVIRVCRSLPGDGAAWAIGKQLIRSGTSVGANFREADRARSSKEFTSILGICVR
ncbi:MAG: four helix bundle protein, partial [Verrucomicrobiota bacterium]